MPINIMHEETQTTITRWATETFGTPDNIMVLFERMEQELTELKWELLKNVGNGDNVRAVGREIADVSIFLDQIAEHVGVDRNTEVDDKMAVNRKRQWKLTEKGTGQHV